MKRADGPAVLRQGWASGGLLSRRRRATPLPPPLLYPMGGRRTCGLAGQCILYTLYFILYGRQEDMWLSGAVPTSELSELLGCALDLLRSGRADGVRLEERRHLVKYKV